jgi:hypothetical protein
MALQSVKWEQWLVLDDGAAKARCTLGQEQVHNREWAADWRVSLPRKLAWAVRSGAIRGEVVVFVEDDDWHSRDHLLALSVDADLYGAQIVGEGKAVYYNVAERRWCLHGNMTHASLCQLAIRREVLPDLARVCERAGEPFVDYRLYATAWRRVVTDPELAGERTTIGIKGMPGMVGYGTGHDRHPQGWREDYQLEALTGWLGEDAMAYEEFFQPSKAVKP